MKLVLQETDIIAGIKLFVQSQGISLTNKTVESTFTAGRKGAGLSVELVIEDAIKKSMEELYTSAATVEALTPVGIDLAKHEDSTAVVHVAAEPEAEAPVAVAEEAVAEPAKPAQVAQAVEVAEAVTEGDPSPFGAATAPAQAKSLFA